MPPISQINGIHLQTVFTKDAPTGHDKSTDKGERSPLTRGSAKFSSSSQRRIQLTTIGQPKARASKITREALKTSSRSIGEALGAIIKGKTTEAGQWMNQARKNLEPMLKSGVLSAAPELEAHGREPESVANEVMAVRIQKHLSSMGFEQLCSLGNILVDKEIEGFPPDFKSMVTNEIAGRARKQAADIRSKFDAPSSPPWLQASLLETDLPSTAGLGRLWARMVGDNPAKFDDIELKASLTRLSKLDDPSKIKAVARELSFDTLSKLIDRAEPPLQGHLKEAFAEKAHLAADWSSIARSVDNLSPTDAMKALARGEEQYRMVELAVEKLGTNAPEGLQAQLRDAHKSSYETAIERILEHPQLLSSLSARDLDHLVNKGRQLGISMSCLPENNLDFISRVESISALRAADGFAKLGQARDALMTCLTKAPLDAKRLEEATMHVYQLVHDEIIPSLAVLDPSLKPETLDFGDSFAVSQMLTFLLTCPSAIIGDGAAMRDRYMKVNSDSNRLLTLDWKEGNLEDHREAIMRAPLDQVSALHARISVRRLSISKAESDAGKRDRYDRNLALLQGRLNEAYAPTVQRLLDGNAPETAMVTGGLSGDKFQKRASGVTRALITSVGLAKTLDAFEAFDSREVGAFRLDWDDPKHAEFIAHYTEARRRAAEAWPEKYISADRIFSSTKWAREIRKQLGVETDTSNTHPLKPL